MIPLSYNLRSLKVRKATTAASAMGISLVVFVLAAAMMLSEGIRKTMSATGQPGNAIVLRKGADAELASSIDQATARLVMDAPGVKRAAAGPSAVGELLTVIALDKADEPGKISNVQVRGVSDDVLSFRSNVQILRGRPAKPGTDEVILGKAIEGSFVGTTLGGQFEIKKNRPVTVVGIFEAAGSSFESEVWADVDSLRTAFGRDNLVSSVTVQLESASKYDVFAAHIEGDKRLELDVMREREYYEKAGEQTSNFMVGMGLVIAVVFSFAAILGALITMQGAVAQRQREIGTLRALGFSRLAVMFSFLIESTMMALLGGAIGLAAALTLGMVEFSMMNFATWSELVFRFEPTPGILIGALIAGGAMGIAGGLLPAIKAARTSPTKAMRA